MGSGRRLTIRQRWVLDHVRDNPGRTIKEIADASPVSEKLTAMWRERFPDSDLQVRSIPYEAVQVALARLRDLGLVRRLPEPRSPADPPYIHFHVGGESEETNDPLEALFNLQHKPGE